MAFHSLANGSMKNMIITTQKEAGVSDEAILNLINESYRVWAENGLDGPFMHYTLEEFRRVTSRAKVFVAIDAETGKLVGTHTFHAKRKQNCVHGSLLAVAPEARKQGIATRMLEVETTYIRKAGFEYMRGFTAVSATWSVRWHLRNGYLIIGYRRSPHENHYTYVFRKQLVPSLLWDSALYCRCRFLLSYAITRLKRDRAGNLTLLGRVGKGIQDRKSPK